MKVLLVDDHPLILAALTSVIEGLGGDVVVRGVETAEAARRALREDDSVDLVLLDLALGETDGFVVLTELRETWPSIPVVVVSASERASDVIRAIDLGAMGFVPKRSSNQALRDALRLVMAGGLYVPPSMLGLDGGREALAGAEAPDLVRRLSEQGQVPANQRLASLESIGLTPRQTEVLALLLQGLPNKLIARRLEVSVETVKDHVAAVLRALNVQTRTQAVLVVSQMTQGQGGFAAMRPAPR